MTHRDVLVEILQQHFMSKPAQVWVERIHAVQVPVGMINNLQQTLEEEQVRFREMVVQIEHPLKKDYVSIGSPIKLSKTPVQYTKAPPFLGEDTDLILQRFVSPQELAQLKDQRVVQQG